MSTRKGVLLAGRRPISTECCVRSFAFKPPVIRVEHDGGVYERGAMFAVVSNHSRFGAGMFIAPEAKIDDGMLDLVVVEAISKVKLLRIFPKVYKGEHVGHPAVTIVRTRSARIYVDRTMTMASDGEPIIEVGEQGVEVSVRPGALGVVVPQPLAVDAYRPCATPTSLNPAIASGVDPYCRIRVDLARAPGGGLYDIHPSSPEDRPFVRRMGVVARCS